MTDRPRRRWLRFWPRTLVGQLIMVLVIALFLTQGIAFLIFADEKRIALRELRQEDTLSRTASIARVLTETPIESHDRVLEAATTRRLKFWVSDARAVEDGADSFESKVVTRRLRNLLEIADERRVLVDVREVEYGLFRTEIEREEEDDDDDDDRHHRWHRRHGPTSLLISIELPDERWLNAENLLRRSDQERRRSAGILLTIILVGVSGLSIFLVRRITKPMKQLAGAAEKAGRGEDVAPLAETGPEEARQTTRAFNDMRQRLKRFIDDRTHMLAATSHDLRTPLTSLRLRAELIDDEEHRAKMLETLDEMQRMVEAMLAFAREDAAQEETRETDLSAMIESIVDDLADMGEDAKLAPSDRVILRCRPLNLKRALRNLIENAVKHGGNADVSIRRGSDTVTITICDNGPGIPDVDLDRIFDPFVRLDKARNQETGGMGLGLAIARSTIRAHGGDIAVANRKQGGLQVDVTLPQG